MTAENQGTGAPDGDDPFAYLYRQEGGGAENGPAPAPQPGVPRRSYNQVQAVGERQYGGGQQQYGAGQQYAGPHQYGGPRAGTQTAPQYGAYQDPYGQSSPSAHYAAPETVPGGRAATRRQGSGGPGGPEGPGRGRGGGGNRNGLLIGAVAVVAAVVIGIGSAMLFNDDDTTDPGGTQAGPAPTAGAEGGGGEEPQQSDGEKKDDEKQKKNEDKGLPKEDAAALRLGGGAVVESTIPGAKGRNGAYVTGMNAVGASAKWTTKLDKAGTYRLYVGYSVPGEDMQTSLHVNGKPHATGLNMKNFAKAAKGDWASGWTYTYATVHLDKGQNSFTVSCQAGDKCNTLLDQVWLAPPKGQ